MKNHGRAIRYVTIIGLVVNLFLSVIKFAAGLVGHSQAVVADAVHSLSDGVSDIAVIVGSYYWTKPADSDHPYGHRRIETLVTLLVGAMLLLAGVGVIRQAVISLNSDAGSIQRPGILASVAVVISIILKELLFRWTKKVGEKVKSPALVANAWHHRSDAFSSVPALISVLAATMLPNFVYLDQIGAILVSLFIMQAAYKILQPGLFELVDASPPHKTCKQIKEIAENVTGVLQVHNLRSRFSGAYLHVDLHLVVDGEITVQEGHTIAGAVQASIMAAELGVIDVVVHVEPTEELH